MTIRRIFYSSAGNANLIDAHESWRAGANIASETALSFSGQVADFVAALDGEALMVSARPDGRTSDDGRFRIEHRPKRSGTGWRYYLAELRNAWSLARAAKAFRADVAVVDSGSMPYFMLALFSLRGIPVVLVLHNTLWPHGFRPSGRLRRLVGRLDARVIGRWIEAVVAVSPEAARQVDELAPGHRARVYQVRAQFDRGYFAAIPPARDWADAPFTIMFIGRVTRSKGVLDVPAMAEQVERALPGRVRWIVCGQGDALGELRALVAAKRLESIVEVPGWMSLAAMQEVYARAHASIVPTRSLFEEGLAMTAVEAILAGRPLVTNPVVPAHELLAPATILGRTNDPASHAAAVIALASDRARYEALRDACAGLGTEFYDRDQGLAAVLGRVIADLDAGKRQ